MKLALRLRRRLGILLMGGERRSMEIATRVHALLSEIDEEVFVRNPDACLAVLEEMAKIEIKNEH